MNSRYTELTLRSIYKVGQLSDRFDDLLRTLVRDCLDRPGLTKERVLTLKIKLKPDPRDPDNVLVEHDLGSRIPGYAADTYRMTTSVAGDLRFQPNFPLDPNQPGLFEDGDDAA